MHTHAAKVKRPIICVMDGNKCTISRSAKNSDMSGECVDPICQSADRSRGQCVPLEVYGN